jgi:hypothetical protein
LQIGQTPELEAVPSAAFEPVAELLTATVDISEESGDFFASGSLRSERIGKEGTSVSEATQTMEVIIDTALV